MLVLFFGILIIIAGLFFGNPFVVAGGCIVSTLDFLGKAQRKQAEPEEAEEITYKHVLIPQEQPPDQTRMPMSATVPDIGVHVGGIIESAEPAGEKHRKRVLGTN